MQTNLHTVHGFYPCARTIESDGPPVFEKVKEAVDFERDAQLFEAASRELGGGERERATLTGHGHLSLAQHAEQFLVDGAEVSRVARPHGVVAVAVAGI